MSSFWNTEFAFQLDYKANDNSDNISSHDYDNQIFNDFFKEEGAFEPENNEKDDTLTKVKDTNTDEDVKSVSTNFLSSKTKREKIGQPKDNKTKRDIFLQKNRESAKKCREKRKKEILDLIKQNQVLTAQLNYFKQKKEVLCPKCKCIVFESPVFINQSANNEGLNNKFIIKANTNSSTIDLQRRNQSNSNSIKRFGLIGGAIAMLCVFSTMMSIQSNLFSSAQSNYSVRSLAQQKHSENRYYSFKTNSSQTDILPSTGPYLSFGDYYSIKTKNAFLTKKYDLINNGKTKIINDTTVANTNMTECDNCVVKISEKHQFRKENDMIKFTLLFPLSPFEESQSENKTFLFYQVDCVAVGFQKNEYYP